MMTEIGMGTGSVGSVGSVGSAGMGMIGMVIGMIMIVWWGGVGVKRRYD